MQNKTMKSNALISEASYQNNWKRGMLLTSLIESQVMISYTWRWCNDRGSISYYYHHNIQTSEAHTCCQRLSLLTRNVFFVLHGSISHVTVSARTTRLHYMGLSPGMSYLDPKWVRLAIHGKKSETLKDNFSTLNIQPKCYWKVIFKSYRFVPFGYKYDIPIPECP